MIPQPRAHGLYNPAAEHDGCGVGFVAQLGHPPSHRVVQTAMEVIANLAHRGAVGAHPTTGDGAGVLVRPPDKLFRAEMDERNIALPQAGQYAVGAMFLPQNDDARKRVQNAVVEILRAMQIRVLRWRAVPVDNNAINDEVRACAPVVRQIFAVPRNVLEPDDLERKLFIARRKIEIAIAADEPAVARDPAGFYCASLSSRLLCYKGMFLSEQLPAFYPDLRNEDFESDFAVLHQRFSTNTFPSWKLAHPYRHLAHNGEINTLRGNINHMLARGTSAASTPAESGVFEKDLARILPLMEDGQSDTATLDNALELLLRAGFPLARAMSALIPQAWQNDPLLSAELRGFFRAHAPMMEPWDGPAEVVATDGKQIAAALDRNGLRPGRWLRTKDDMVVMASEAGVADIPDAEIVRKGRIRPGKILLLDLESGELREDEEVKNAVARRHPYAKWARENQIPMEAVPPARNPSDDLENIGGDELLKLQRCFGCTEEDLKFILRPMSETGAEPVGSMGDDAPQAVLSSRPKPLFSYFRQEFAQVTNPAIDPIREEVVMSLHSWLGPRPNLFTPDAAPEEKLIALEHPILTPAEMAALRGKKCPLDCATLDATFPADGDPAESMRRALEELKVRAEAMADLAGIIIVSDRQASPSRMPIPILLAVSAAHQALIADGKRDKVGVVAETGAAREVHHFAVLAGYGADAVYPYLAYRTVHSPPPPDPEKTNGAAAVDTVKEGLTVKGGPGESTPERRALNYRKAVGKGVLKVMSKMGVSAYQSYCGAQIFEAVGLGEEFVAEYFPRTVTQIGGAGLEEIARETAMNHRAAFGSSENAERAGRLDEGGDYAYRIRGERHLWTPGSVSKLQHAVRKNDFADYEEYARLINEQGERLMTLRGMLEIVPSPDPVPLDEVEPAANIVRRFSTGAMSFGSISWEAHTTLAIAMNRIGGKSNTGEGGEGAERYIPLENGDSMRSAIKQVASGRFGVTAEYLANADMMQIKIAQGAKPGEGGQLPGGKVDENIARVRHSVPGVGLISPPPHHDIYSIEDIAQLIFDLKCANPAGMVSVKLVSRCGVGTVAAGVAKAKSDHITIAGHDGGTGASPLSSIKHAGTPWELGLSETHQTLVLNGLRGRIALQVDGQIKTGRDVAIGALLGADEFGFATAPLVAQGCVMMRKCHLNTCPVGIATQDPVLRAKFAGRPEHVVNYFFFVAEEVRRLMALTGFRKFDEMIGQTARLRQREVSHWKARKLNLSRVLQKPEAPESHARFNCERQNHNLESLAIDYQWTDAARPAIERGEKTTIKGEVRNIHRAAGAVLSNQIARKHGHKGLPDDTLTIRLAGSAGQSFGAFLARGISMILEGEANDYLGKGLSGGVLAVSPPESERADGENILAGNTALYGAISGECFCRGVAGERFAVRNSGANAVLEGAGDHCCEYMTGGTVVILGDVGRNFGAGMSGGVAYALDPDGRFARRCNTSAADLEKLDHLGTGPGLHMGRTDSDIVRGLLKRHLELTGSPKAEEILREWEKFRPFFVKFFPHEYRRVLMNGEGKKAA